MIIEIYANIEKTGDKPRLNTVSTPVIKISNTPFCYGVLSHVSYEGCKVYPTPVEGNLF